MCYLFQNCKEQGNSTVQLHLQQAAQRIPQIAGRFIVSDPELTQIVTCDD